MWAGPQCHPRHIFHGIIIGEAKRMLRNSSNFETYNEAIVKLVHNFLRRGYPLKFIKKHLKNIKFEHRLEVLHPSKITKYLTKPDSTTLKIPYHPGHKHSIKNILIDDRLPFIPKVVEVLLFLPSFLPQPPSAVFYFALYFFLNLNCTSLYIVLGLARNGPFTCPYCVGLRRLVLLRTTFCLT